MLRTTILSLFILLPQLLKAQILPKDGAVLNYRLIGFSFPVEKKTLIYSIEIASGNITSEDNFKKNTIRKIQGKTNKIITEVPAFGSSYTWRVIYTFSKSSQTHSALFHFTTGIIPDVDPAVSRLKININKLGSKEAFVFVDDSRTLYNMKGEPVWYLPPVNGVSITPRDLKLSPHGTITFMSDPPYEVNYNGEVLWKAPSTNQVSGDYNEHFHHEFTRLPNGHYMMLGEDSAVLGLSNQSSVTGNTSGKNFELPNGLIGKKLQFGTLIEYDASGKVTWSWKSSNYFKDAGIRDLADEFGSNDIDVHENSFYFDEKNNNIYISFKNLNRILKVKYPEGTVVNSYNGTDKNGVAGSLFCGQHAVKHSSEGYLYLFDNNSCDLTSLPKVELLEESGPGNSVLTKIWEYELQDARIDKSERAKNYFPSGGNVVELNDRSMFVCVSGNIFSSLFIVNHEKEVLWSAALEKWNAFEKKWGVSGQYRASIIENRKDLERLIWNAEINTRLADNKVINGTSTGVSGTR